MKHDELQQMLAPLASVRGPTTRDVTAWVMADVRRSAASHVGDDDRLIWRLAAVLSATAAVCVVVASISIAPADDPLAEFAQQTTPALEIR